MIAFFHIFSNSSFINHPTIWCYIVWAADNMFGLASLIRSVPTVLSMWCGATSAPPPYILPGICLACFLSPNLILLPITVIIMGARLRSQYSDWLQAGRLRGRSSSPSRVKNFLHVAQTRSGAHPTSYPMDTGGSFSGGKAAGAWSWPLTSN
jgi:molybdopterin biosynthesis enzyme